MDLPPSGWYPDPYEEPGLLRWWDGSAWTEHTHAGGGTSAADGAEPATVQPTTVQPTTVQPATVQPTTVQPTTVQPTTVQPTTVQPTTVQPAAPQRSSLQATVPQPAALLHAGGRPDAGGNGTQVLFRGDDAWSASSGAGAGAGAADGAPGDPYGYQRAVRRRRMWLATALAAGTVAALAVIALVVIDLGKTPAPAATPASSASSAATAPVAAATTQPPPSPTPSTTTATSTLTDGQSGLSYTQLAAPWQPTCPSGLNNQGFTWTAGESAIAGQVNGGQTTWYGAACSGPLPQQYGYSGVADLENVTSQLANQFNGTYYGALSHTVQQEVSQPVQVSGHAGWEVKFLITYTNPQGQGLSWTDELAAVVVADTGTGTPPAVFYVSVPGNLDESNVDTLVSSLQLTAPPQPVASPPATGSPAPGAPTPGAPAPGAPAPGGNGNGNQGD